MVQDGQINCYLEKQIVIIEPLFYLWNLLSSSHLSNNKWVSSLAKKNQNTANKRAINLPFAGKLAMPLFFIKGHMWSKAGYKPQNTSRNIVLDRQINFNLKAIILPSCIYISHVCQFWLWNSKNFEMWLEWTNIGRTDRHQNKTNKCVLPALGLLTGLCSDKAIPEKEVSLKYKVLTWIQFSKNYKHFERLNRGSQNSKSWGCF